MIYEWVKLNSSNYAEQIKTDEAVYLIYHRRISTIILHRFSGNSYYFKVV